MEYQIYNRNSNITEEYLSIKKKRFHIVKDVHFHVMNYSSFYKDLSRSNIC